MATVIKPDELGALENFGSFKKILSPGLHFLTPGSSIRKISTRVVENRVVTETKTSDNVFVTIHIAVQQEVSKDNAYEAIYKLNNAAVQIESFVSDVVRSHAPTTTLDQLFEAKEEIANDVKNRLTAAMASYGYLIHQVLVTDIAPDQQVKDAMNQINANRRLRMAAQEKAEADKIVLVKAAEGEAERKFLQGQGIARSRTAIVEGLKSAVAGPNAKSALSTKDVTELLVMTQYLETLERLSQGENTTLFMPHSIGGLSTVMADIRRGVQEAN